MLDVWDNIDEIMEAFSPSVGSLIDMSKSRNLPILDVIEKRLEAMLKAFGRSSFAEELIGNVMTALVGKALGFESTDLKTGYHGIDGVMKQPKTGTFMILEAKGGQSTLSSGPPRQMSRRWIDDKVDRLLSRSRNEGSLDSDDLRRSRSRNNLYAVVVRVDIPTSASGKFAVVCQIQQYPIRHDWHHNL